MGASLLEACVVGWGKLGGQGGNRLMGHAAALASRRDGWLFPRGRGLAERWNTADTGDWGGVPPRTALVPATDWVGEGQENDSPAAPLVRRG